MRFQYSDLYVLPAATRPEAAGQEKENKFLRGLHDGNLVFGRLQPLRHCRRKRMPWSAADSGSDAGSMDAEARMSRGEQLDRRRYRENGNRTRYESDRELHVRGVLIG